MVHLPPLPGSPRAALAVAAIEAQAVSAARALAAAEERDFSIPDDVKALALPVLSHRVIVTADAVMGGKTSTMVLQELLHEVAVPVSGTA
jgi:MoxR-like ATPase